MNQIVQLALGTYAWDERDLRDPEHPRLRPRRRR